MKKYLILITLIFTVNVNAQLRLEISEVYISSISDSSSFKFEDFEGPNISARCKLFNPSQDTLLILPLRDSIILSYYLKGLEYERVLRPYNFPDRLSIIINPFDTLTFSFSDNIFLGTSYKKDCDFDYANLLIELLPTLRIEYRTKYLPLIINERIKMVKLL